MTAGPEAMVPPEAPAVPAPSVPAPSVPAPSVPSAVPTPSAVHYENEVALFQAFLDDYMKYGSGYFEAGDDLDAASRRMLDRALSLARLPEAGGLVLDVGSGWGSLRRRLAERHARATYHHVNPSEVQRAFQDATFGPAPFTFPGRFEDAPLARAAYDAVFFQDSFCHMQSRAEALRRAGELLREDGRIVLQDTFFLSEALHERHHQGATTRFIQEDVFGYASIGPLEELVSTAAAAGLRLLYAEDVSAHYLRTVHAWLTRLEGLDPARHPLRDTCLRYLRKGAACMQYTTGHFLLVLGRRVETRARLRENLLVLRRGAPSEVKG